MARTRLNVDWDSLFPGDTLTIGSAQVVIKPLGILALATVAKQLKGFAAIISEEGITWENYGTPENIIKLASILLDQFPAVIAEASNIEEEDVVRLPLEHIVALVDKIFEVNLKSRDDLEKNFLSLAGKFQKTVKTKK